MSGGTGLPIPKNGDLRAQAPGVIDGDRLSSASAWRQIAAAGEKLASAGFSIAANEGRIAEKQQNEQERLAAKEKAQLEAAYYADREVEAQRTFAEISNKNHDNPKGFDAEWNGFVEGKLSEAEPWAIPSLKKFYGGLGVRGFTSALQVHRNKSEADAKDSVTARLTMADNDLMGLAAAGKIGTPEWQAAQTTYDGVIQSGRDLGLFNDDEVKLRRDDIAGRIQSEEASRSTRSVYAEKGYDAAVQHARASILENDKLTLSPAAKYRAFNRAMTDLRLDKAEQEKDRQAHIDTARDLQARVEANPDQVDPAEVKSVMDALQRSGAPGHAQRLGTAVAKAQTLGFIRGLPLPQQAAYIAGSRAETGGAAALLRRFEGFIDTPKWDVNALRVGYGSDTITKEDGSVVRVAAGMRVSREDAERDLARRIKEFEGGIVKDIGEEAWGKLTPNARAALTSVAYNYGSLPNGVAQAATRGDPEAIAQAIEGLQGHNDGINRTRRLQEAAIARGGAIPATAPNIGQVTKVVQNEFVKNSREAWPSFKAQLSRGEQPDVEYMASVKLAAEISGDAGWKEEIAAVEAGFTASQKLDEFSSAGGRAAIDELRSTFEEGGLAPTESTILQALEAQYERQQKAVAEDPVGFAVKSNPRQKPVPPLDFSSAESAAAGISQRVQLAQWTATTQEVAPGNPLQASDRRQIEGVLRGEDARAVTVAINALGQVPDEMLPQALASMKPALIAAAATTDPAKHQAVMSGLDQIERRAPDLFQREFGERMVARIETWQSLLAYQKPDEIQKFLQRRFDGTSEKVFKEREQAAEAFARKKEPADIVKELRGYTEFGDRLPTDVASSTAFMAEYRSLVRLSLEETLDVETAHKAAVRMLGTVWRTSPANGGRLTKHAPEAHYPTVGQSHSWIGEQLQADLRARLGIAGGPQTAEAQNEFGITETVVQPSAAPIRYAIVASPETQADIAAGSKAPRYRVVYTNPATGKLEDVLWQGDPQKAVTPQTAGAIRRQAEGDATAQGIRDRDLQRRRALDEAALNLRFSPIPAGPHRDVGPVKRNP